MSQNQPLCCILCGLEEPAISFSKRQRKKGNDAKCTACVDQEQRSPAPAQESKRPAKTSTVTAVASEVNGEALAAAAGTSQQDPTTSCRKDKVKDDASTSSSSSSSSSSSTTTSSSCSSPTSPSQRENSKPTREAVDKDTAQAQEEAPTDNTLDISTAIPRRKRPRSALQQDYNWDDDDVDDDDNNNNDEDDGSHSSDRDDPDRTNEPEISLNDLKRQIMGRDLRTEDDHEDPENDPEHIQDLLRTKPLKLSTRHLQEELDCVICQDVLYPPVTLLCGHSFCQSCFEWWFSQKPSCPTCRANAPQMPGLNRALQTCLRAIFPQRVAQKIQRKQAALQRTTKGEHGGAHSRGYQVLSPIHDEYWHSIALKSTGKSSSQPSLKIRRNIVLDADDQRMQLACACYEPPLLLENGLQIQLCLLTMEEDEASEMGFPPLLSNIEDEQLLATHESRFSYSAWEVNVQMAEIIMDDSNDMDHDQIQWIPWARISPQVQSPGFITYRFEYNNSSESGRLQSLQWKHEDTGACLELDVSSLQTGATGSTFSTTFHRPRMEMSPSPSPSPGRWSPPTVESKRRKKESMVLDEVDRGEDDDDDDDDDNDDDEGSDGFEDDGFLVHEDQEDDEEEDGDDNDNDVCAICKDGGELMICDAQDMEGCGKSVHPACVGRSEIPEGDWICSDCAQSGGIAVEGNCGHEFPVKGGGGGPKALLDDDDDVGDDDDEEKAENNEKMRKIVKNGNKRRLILEDTDDED